jgi:hypothetical protein
MKLPMPFFQKTLGGQEGRERKMLAISAIFYSLEIKGNEGRRLQIRSDAKL